MILIGNLGFVEKEMAKVNRYINNDIKLKLDNGQIFHYEITDIDRTLREIHGDKYSLYRKEWELASKLGKIDRPLYLVMETNSYCNMKCRMCIRNYDITKNRKKNVPLDNILKIANEGRELGVPSFLVGAEAECLINPEIKEILHIVKERGGGIDNFIITNGYELTEDISKFLIEMQWERIYISLDAATAQTYQRVRGMDLDRVEKNIERLLELRDKNGSMLPLVRVSFVIQNENRDEKQLFIDKWKNKVDIIDFQNLIHYENMEIQRNLPDIDYQCAYPFRTMLIDCDGEIYPCCTEYGYKMPIGNIRTMSIKQAWESERMKKIRDSIIEKKLCDVCKNCALKIEENNNWE